MVKVQKPIPKSLDKIDTKSHQSIKKKKDKLKHTGAAVSSQVEALPSKKKQKVKLIKGMIKDSEVVTSRKEKVGKPEHKKNKEKKKITSEASTNDDVPTKKKKTEKENIVNQKGSNSLSSNAPLNPMVTTPSTNTTPDVSLNKEKKKEKKIKDKSKKNQTSTVPSESLTENIKNKKGKLKPKVCEDETNINPKEQQKKPVELTPNIKKLPIRNKNKQSKMEKKEKVIDVPVPFDEDKFNAVVNLKNIKNIATALKAQVAQEVAKKKNIIFSDYTYILNVASFKIPNCPKRMVKLNLKHSLVDKNNDIVIIVPDLKRGSRIDYEPTIEHYDNLFRQAGVEGLKIIPFNQLKKEYQTFESVRKFANTYDYFLCDGRVVGHVVGFCGKIFQKPRTTFHSVRLNNPQNLKKEIEKSLRRTAYKQLNKGDLISIPVGNHKYTMQQLAENIDIVVKQLKTILPGGLPNIRNITLRIDMVGTSALPIYISMCQAPPTTPYVVGPREERMLKLKRKANEVLTKFAMTKDANLLKLAKGEIEKKRKIKEAREALLAKSLESAKDGDGEESAVPKKKARKEERDDTIELKKKNSCDQAEPGDDVGEDPGENSDEENADDDSESEDNENDMNDDDDEEDDEENGDVDEAGEGDDDENEDDEDGDDDDNEDEDDDDDDDDSDN